MPVEELREALRGLCCGHGWSYGALWRPDRCDPRLLMMEECYYEEQIRTVIDKMQSRVHVVGEGTLGAVAVSGKHQWIYSDTCIDPSATSTGDHLDMFQGNTEWQHQFTAGIKTIVIISLASFGVVHFGSSQKVPESLEFVNQVKYLFQQLESMMVHFITVDAQKAMDISDPYAAFASVISFGEAYSSNKKINSLCEDTCEAQLFNTHSSKGRPIHPSSFFSLESHNGTRFHSGSMSPHTLAIPVISSATGASTGLNNSISRNKSFQLANQCEATGTSAQALLSPNTGPDCSCPDNSLANCLDASMWAKEIASLPVLEQRLFSGMTVQRFPSMTPAESHFSLPYVDSFDHFGGFSSKSCSRYGSQGELPGIKSSETSKCCLYDTEKLLNFQHSSSSSSFLAVDVSTNKSCSKETSFASDLPDNFFTLPRHLTPERYKLVHSKDDPVSDLVHSSSQPLEQLSSVLTVPMNDDLLSVSCVSSGFIGGSSVDCSKTTELPSRLLENSVASVVNSLNAGSDRKANSSNASTLLFSDNDLFDGMELDLSPRILRQNNWDDIILPVGSDNCSNLRTSVPECIGMDSVDGADKCFFAESSLEQLLDSIVTGNVTQPSSHSSVVTNTNSVADLNSEPQLSKITNSAGPQVYRNQIPLAGHPSLSRTSDMSLPECSLEKIMQGSPKESLAKSHVSSWIDDTCSMNTESSVINQTKKPEEAAKAARKRARPGESTRPRPKDRQQIQDRVKELREIVPNGAKCSIDSLLDRTIKHMLFLQSVTKYADKLKQADEPKMIGNESGVVLKDNLSGGATWAYEVAGQTMVCPILVEDLNPPGQMLVEMLCEDRGFFLEIADIIRGFGLTILKGVMEIRNKKIWARFLVEANREVTRMDIFLSLVQLLQQTSCIRSSDQPAKAIEKGDPAFSDCKQPLAD